MQSTWLPATARRSSRENGGQKSAPLFLLEAPYSSKLRRASEVLQNNGVRLTRQPAGVVNILHSRVREACSFVFCLSFALSTFFFFLLSPSSVTAAAHASCQTPRLCWNHRRPVICYRKVCQRRQTRIQIVPSDAPTLFCPYYLFFFFISITVVHILLFFIFTHNIFDLHLPAVLQDRLRARQLTFTVVDCA